MPSDTEAHKPAKFLTFEGGEGVGKTTQIARLGDRLTKRGYEVVTTREPGGTPFADRLREALLAPEAGNRSALAEALAFYAARADHLQQVIRPALAAGQWVLCDRFSDSTRAYQGAAGGIDRADLARLDRLVVRGTTPDLTLILDLPVEVGLARARSRGAYGQNAEQDAFEQRDAAFHERLRTAFQEIATESPDRCAIIDASGEADQVSARIWEILRRRGVV